MPRRWFHSPFSRFFAGASLAGLLLVLALVVGNASPATTVRSISAGGHPSAGAAANPESTGLPPGSVPEAGDPVPPTTAPGRVPTGGPTLRPVVPMTVPAVLCLGAKAAGVTGAGAPAPAGSALIMCPACGPCQRSCGAVTSAVRCPGPCPEAASGVACPRPCPATGSTRPCLAPCPEASGGAAPSRPCPGPCLADWSSSGASVACPGPCGGPSSCPPPCAQPDQPIAAPPPAPPSGPGGPAPNPDPRVVGSGVATAGPAIAVACPPPCADAGSGGAMPDSCPPPCARPQDAGGASSSVMMIACPCWRYEGFAGAPAPGASYACPQPCATEPNAGAMATVPVDCAPPPRCGMAAATAAPTPVANCPPPCVYEGTAGAPGRAGPPTHCPPPCGMYDGTAGAPAGVPGPATGAPAPASTNCPPPCAAAARPCPPQPGQLVITEADDGGSFTVAPGTTVMVNLHWSGWYWSAPRSSDESVLATRQSSADPNTGDASGTFAADKTGDATITAFKEPACARGPGPRCMMPVRQWQVHISVRPTP